MLGGIRFEHTHRVIAGVVGLLTAALAVFAWRADARRWVRFLSLGALLAVVLQAVLGGLTVIYLLPDAVSVSHACLAQTFFCVVLALALFTSGEWKTAARINSPEGPALKRLLVFTTSLVYLQLVAGAVVRHTHGAHGLTAHLALAFLIPLHALLVVLRVSREDTLRARFSRHAVVTSALVIVQIFLGFASFLFTQMLKRPEDVPAGIGEVFFRTAHQTNGALILGACVLLTLRVFRLVAPATEKTTATCPTTGESTA